MKLITKMSLIILFTFISFFIYLRFFPFMENNILATSTITMAIATFIMACITYMSYQELIKIQKADFEPRLAISFDNIKKIIKIKNDGPGTAINCRLSYNWAVRQMQQGIAQRFDIREEDFNGGAIDLNIGNIASKESNDLSVLTSINRLHNLPSGFIDYAVRLRITCEDQFGARLDKYSDTKTIFKPEIDTYYA